MRAVGVPMPQPAYGVSDDQVLDVPDGELARGGAFAGGALGLMGCLEQRLSLRQKGATGFREPAALWGAVEEAHAQMFLEMTWRGRSRRRSVNWTRCS